MQETAAFNAGLLDFIARSPTPFHAVQNMAARLRSAGFRELREADHWQLREGEAGFVIRNGSSIVAFRLGAGDPSECGFRLVGAHTDSPCLKVKPQPELKRQGFFQLGVEVYGGVLLNPWFDRDLSLAGRVSFRSADGQVRSTLIDWQRPVAIIPSLAIHLDREANLQHSVNAQRDIPPVLMMEDKNGGDFRALLLLHLQDTQPALAAQRVLDYELSFYDCQPPALVGLRNEFIASARLDNLLSCFVGMQALIESNGQHCVLVCNDHEEVGSMSIAGAKGPLLKSVLLRIAGDATELHRAIDRSLMVSADNAHGVHPNFADKHDGNHGPLLNSGPVIKINANQSYATNSETAALFRHLCELADVPVQAFVVRTDMACGSTIGPLTAGELGVRTVDVGVPTFAMHSIRELAGYQDSQALYRALLTFFAQPSVTLAAD